MEKIDALDWVSRDLYDILGKAVLVRSTSEQFAAEAARMLRGFQLVRTAREMDVMLSFHVGQPSQVQTIRPYHFAYNNYAQTVRSTDYWALHRQLEVQIDKTVSDMVSDRLLLHSAVVGRDGGAIVMAGEPGRGKSSVCLELVLRGYDYYSDEIASISFDDGRVSPFAKAVGLHDLSLWPDIASDTSKWVGPAVRPAEAGEKPTWHVHPEDLRPGCTGRPAPVRYIVFPEYMQGATPKLERMSGPEAMTGLLGAVVNAREAGRPALHAVAGLVRNAQLYRLTSNSLDSAAGLIEEMIGA